MAGKRKYEYLPVPVAALSKGLRPLICWDCGFESSWEQGCLSLMSVVRCQVEVPVTGWSPVQRSPTESGVSECHRETLIMKGPDSCAMAGGGGELQNCTLGQIYHKILSVFRVSSAIMPVIVLWIVTPLILVYWYQLLIVLTLPVS